MIWPSHRQEPSTCRRRSLSIQASRQVPTYRQNTIEPSMYSTSKPPELSNYVSLDMISMHIRHHDSPHPSVCRAQDPKAGQGSIVNQPRSFWRQAKVTLWSTHGLVRLPALQYQQGAGRYGVQGLKSSKYAAVYVLRALTTLPVASRLPNAIKLVVIQHATPSLTSCVARFANIIPSKQVLVPSRIGRQCQATV